MTMGFGYIKWSYCFQDISIFKSNNLLSLTMGVNWEAKKLPKKICFLSKVWYNLINIPLQNVFNMDQHALGIVEWSLSFLER